MFSFFRNNNDGEKMKNLCASLNRASIEEIRQLARSRHIVQVDKKSKKALCNELLGEKSTFPVVFSHNEIELLPLPSEFRDPYTGKILFNPMVNADGISLDKKTTETMLISSTLFFPNKNLQQA